MPNLMENKLFLQYLSGAGAAIGGEGSFASGLNQITQQNIATQNYMKMVGQQQKQAKGRHQEHMDLIRELLGGGAKISMDKDNVSIKAPSALLGGEEGMSSIVGGGGAATKQEFDTLNPSASPLDVSSADLAGLTPQNISQALQLGMASEELGSKKVSELMDMVYKRDVLASKDKRTGKIQNYEYYVKQEKEAGRTPKSIEKWDAGFLKEKRLYEEAVLSAEREDYPFDEWLLDWRKLGGVNINLGDFRAKKEITAEVSRKSFFKTPKFRTGVEKIVDDTRRIEFETSDDPKKARSKFVWEEMDKQVKTSYPDVVFGKDSKTGIIGWYSKSGELIASWQ